MALPSIRFGDVHIFGNSYASLGAHLAISAGVRARVLVEEVALTVEVAGKRSSRRMSTSWKTPRSAPKRVSAGIGPRVG